MIEKLECHLRFWGILYAMWTYILFITCYTITFGLSESAEIAGISMVFIGLFWLLVINIFSYIRKQTTLNEEWV